MRQMENKIEDFTVLSVIGTGSFGTCYKVLRKETGEIFVWKAVDYGRMPEEKKQLLVSEVNLLSGLKHPNIVRYYDRIIHKPTTTIYIIMEWCAGGDLAYLVNECRRNNSRLEEKFVWRVLYQLARALQACHSFMPQGPVLHRDIKPANVFLDGCGNVKLGDFGLAYLMQDGKSGAVLKVVGTPFYISPEAIQEGCYSVKSDIWALGCLVYELCALQPPFEGSNLRRLFKKIQEARFDRIPPVYSEDLQSIISFMLRSECSVRPSVDAILHHPSVVMHIVQSTLESTPGQLCCCHHPDTPDTSFDASAEEKTKAMDALVLKSDQLRKWENALRIRELQLGERERAVTRKEKEVSLAQDSVKDMVKRAELYLKRCRSVSSSKSIVYDVPLDSSVCTDQGDTSLLPKTTAKLNPSKVEKPAVFVRMVPEKHVHFGTLPRSRDSRSVSTLSETGVNIQNGMVVRATTSQEHRDAASIYEVPKKIKSKRSSASSSENSSGRSTAFSMAPSKTSGSREERLWSQQKRAACFGNNKENVAVNRTAIDQFEELTSERYGYVRQQMAHLNLV